MNMHHVVVDGSNIATEGRSLPSLRQLDEAVRAFLAEHPTEHLTVIVDATFGHRIDPSERDEYEEAISAGELLTPPAGAIGRGDAFVLQVADRADAVILSNDSFQEFHGQYDWLFDEGRLMGGKPVPGVGWVFLLRTPVRGPTSRRAVSEARRKARQGAQGGAAPAKKAAGRAPRPAAPAREPANRDGGGRGRRRDTRKPDQPVNEPLPFIEFVANHPVGSEIDAVVDRFSSHGAYAVVDDAHCYIPLRLMGEPTPRSAKEVLTVGEAARFRVHAIDGPTRGIDLELVRDAAPSTTGAVAVDERPRAPRGGPRGATRGTTRTTTGGTTRGTTRGTSRGASRDDVIDDGSASARDSDKTHTTRASAATKRASNSIAEEAPVTPAKKATKKSAAKKAVKKAPAKKATAKKAAKKAPAKKATAKKAAKKAPAKKATAKKAAKKATKKAPAKKATAKKAAKKAPAKKATAKKAAKKATKKAPAKKR